MKKTTRMGLHLGYWSLYSFLVSFLFLLSQATDQLTADGEDWLTILLFALLVGVSSFYVFYGWLAPAYLPTRRIRHFMVVGLLVSLGIGLLSTLLVSLATTLILYVALHTLQWILFDQMDQWVLITGFTLLALINGVTGTLLRGSISWYTDIHLKERLANQGLRAELGWLKAQLNPHFLFNTLHNIDILIEYDAPRASLYLNKLSDLLRFSLYETQTDQIPLTRELASIEKYIELQKIRMANDQSVTLHVEGESSGLQIAPMLFMPYLENAFKFATNKKVAEAIRIHIRVDDDRIRFRCINLIDESKLTPKNSGGLGQELLRQRLALLYPQHHTLTIEASATAYLVDLTLSLNAHALPAD